MVATPSGVPGFPPIPRTRLIGRERELALARTLLVDQAVPCLTLTGPGGVGKTRLALAIAHEVAPHFADGIAYVPLAPVRDPDLVLPTIARGLGIPEHSGTPLETLLAAALRDRHLLLVLDNLEQVTAAGILLGALLESCPRLQLVVTSRVRLHLGVEHLLPVRPLPLPAHRDLLPATLIESPAVSLFIERTQQIRPAFALTPENAATVVSIVECLDGLPLAIELAAARLSALSPEALLSRLEHRLHLLRGGRPDLPPRLRTMADAIAWSYDLLDPAEQALLRRLAIFLGGWTIEAAEAIYAAIGDPPIDVFDGVTSLVDKSLVQPLLAAAADPRFTMLETVREFGLERLSATGELQSAREAHASWCLALAEAAEPHLGGAAQGEWLDRLEREHDNLRAALAWWQECGDAAHGLRLATALMRFWDTRDYMSEGRSHLMTFLALPGAAHAPRAHAKALAAISELASWEAEHAIAANYAAEALAIWRELNDLVEVARILWLLGVNTLYIGDAEAAKAIADEGLALARRIGDREAEALNLRLFGIVHRDEPTLAISSFEAAIALWQELGARAELGSDLGELAFAVGQEGDRARAIALWEQVVPLAHEVGEEWMLAYLLEGYAELALDAGRAALAARWLGAADAWRVAHGAPVLGTGTSTFRAFATSQDQLGADAYAQALASGQALALDEAVRDAQEMQALLLDATPARDKAVPEWAASFNLTPREYEVLRLLGQRWSDREIANALFVSPRTIQGHVAAILAKLGVANRRVAALLAAQHGPQ